MSKVFELLKAILFIVLGILIVIDASHLTNFIAIVIGVVIIIFSVLQILSGLTISFRMVINGIIGVIVGVLIVTNATLVKDLFSIILGVIITLTCLNNLFLVDKSIPKREAIIYRIILIIDIIFGILCIVGSIVIPDLVILFIGILLFIYGVIETINFFIAGKENDIENII